jgi:hypothetical protein
LSSDEIRLRTLEADSESSRADRGRNSGMGFCAVSGEKGRPALVEAPGDRHSHGDGTSEPEPGASFPFASCSDAGWIVASACCYPFRALPCSQGIFLPSVGPSGRRKCGTLRPTFGFYLESRTVLGAADRNMVLQS